MFGFRIALWKSNGHNSESTPDEVQFSTSSNKTPFTPKDRATFLYTHTKNQLRNPK